MTPHHFAEHLTVLQESVGTVRPLDELLGESVIGRVAARRAGFAVTFDDGYVDNLEAAIPILERFQTPATVFIAPGLLDRRSFWWDVLAELVLGSGLDAHRVLSAAGASDVLDGAVPSTGPIDSRTVHDLLRSQLIRRHVDAIEVALDGLASALGFELPVPDGRPMTTAELTALAASPLISIGVHSMTHPRLPDLPPGEVRQEIDVARAPARRVARDSTASARLSLRCVVARRGARRRRSGLRSRRHHRVAVAAPARRGSDGASTAPAQRGWSDVRRVAAALDLILPVSCLRPSRRELR